MGRVDEDTVVVLDPAVRRIKRLPRSHVKVQPQRLVCRRDGYRFDSLIQAWVHSELHGPWEPTDSGSRSAHMVRDLTLYAYQNTPRFQNAVRVQERLKAMGL